MHKKYVKILKNILCIVTICVLISATILTANAQETYTTPYGMQLMQYSADIMSVSMRLPSQGGNRIYLNSNMGMPTQEVQPNTTYTTATYSAYTTAGRTYEIMSDKSFIDFTLSGRNTTTHRIRPQWISELADVNTLRYTFDIYMPFAIVDTTRQTSNIINYAINLYQYQGNFTSGYTANISYYYQETKLSKEDGTVYYNSTPKYVSYQKTVEEMNELRFFDNQTIRDTNSTALLVYDITITLTCEANSYTSLDTGPQYANEDDIILIVSFPWKTDGLKNYVNNANKSTSAIVQKISLMDFNITDFLTKQIDGLLSVKILPLVTIGSILWFIVGIGIFFFLLKTFLGG